MVKFEHQIRLRAMELAASGGNNRADIRAQLEHETKQAIKDALDFVSRHRLAEAGIR